VDEVSLSVANQTNDCNIDSLIGLDNLCNCFYGKYDKDPDYGDDGNFVDCGDDLSSKAIDIEMREVTGLDKLIDAINDSKIFGEYDDELHSMQSVTYCGESIATEEEDGGGGEDFNVDEIPPPPRPRPRGGIANTDAIKMKSVVFVAPNAVNTNSTMRFLA
jgi:hypothetical protein